MNIAQVNRHAKIFGYELVHDKGEHYFYWFPLDGRPEFKESGVYVYHLNDLVLSEWIRDLVHKIDVEL